MNDKNIIDALTTLAPEDAEEAEALLSLGRYVASRGYDRLRENAIHTYLGGVETEGLPEHAMPANLWVTEPRDKTENDLILDAIVASERGYWDDDPGGPYFRVKVERRSGTDRRKRAQASEADRRRDLGQS